MSTTASHSPFNISETVIGLVPKDHQQDYGESNGHVINDVT